MRPLALFLVIPLLAFGRAQLRSPQTSSPAVKSLSEGDELLAKGDYGRAVAYFKEGLAAGPHNRETLDIRRRLSLALFLSDDLVAANASAREALEDGRALGLREETASLEANVASLEDYAQAQDLMYRGDLAGSDRLFAEALSEAKAAGSPAFEQKVLRAWSICYLGMPEAVGRYLELNEQALAIAQALGYRLEAGRALNNIGAIRARSNDYSHALISFFNALNVCGADTAAPERIKSLNNLAGVFISLGDYVKAHDYMTEAMSLAAQRHIGLFQPSLFVNMGQILEAQARRLKSPELSAKAMDFFKSCLAQAQGPAGASLRLHALAGISGVDIDRGRLDEAEAVITPELDRLRNSGDPALRGMVLLNLGAISLGKGRLEEAGGHFAEALNVARAQKDLLQTIRAATGLGRCWERRGDIGRAMSFYEQAVTLISRQGSGIVDDNNRAEFISRTREPYQALIDLYRELAARSGQAAFEREIFRVAETLRGRSFMEQLNRRARRSDTSGSGDSVPAENEGQSAERLRILETLSRGVADPNRAEDLRARIRHLDDMMDAALFSGLAGPAGPSPAAGLVSLNVLQKSILPDRTALLEYFLGDSRSYLMAVTKSAFRLADLPSAGALEDSLEGYLGFLQNPGLPAAKGVAAARRIYAELISPVEGLIDGGVDRLIIVPDGLLFHLPFETLVRGDTDGRGAARLVDRYVISYSPSASALMHFLRRPAAVFRKDLLAFGVSDYVQKKPGPEDAESQSAAAILDSLYRRSGFVLSPLPFAGREIADLARRVRPARADVVFGPKATELAFKKLDLRSYRVVHLACHAFSDDNYPLRSALVFSQKGDPDEDGYLQVSELSRMKTDADLVVLSACQTGRGRVVANEGVLGLPRVFFYMGARSVLATLWPVADRASAEFMRHFYDAYFGGAGKAAALQAAKRKMSAGRYSHPYYWASYTLTGEY